MVFFLSATRRVNQVDKSPQIDVVVINLHILHTCIPSSSKVRYPENEDRQVLQLKKAVTSSFSLRLHNYVRNKGATKQHGGWSYRVPDLDHSGAHSARLVLYHM